MSARNFSARYFSSANIFQQADFNFRGTAKFDFFLEKFVNGLNRRMNVLGRLYTQKGLEMVAESLHFIATFYKGTQ